MVLLKRGLFGSIKELFGTFFKPGLGPVPFDDVTDRMETYIQNCGFFDDSASECAERVQHDLEFYNGGTFTCAVTYQFPAWGWQTWSAVNNNYQVAMILRIH